MRCWTRPLLLTAVLAAAISVSAGPVAAQDAPKTTPNTAPNTAPKTMAVSPMAQVPFAEQPFPLRDDGTFKSYLEKIAADVGRTCGKQESYGWEFRKGDQDKMDRIFQTTMGSFEKTGWLVGETKAKSVQDPLTTVYLADKDRRRLLLVWVPMQDAAMLIMCETKGPVPKK